MADNETIDVYDAQAETYSQFVSSPEPEPALQDFIDALPAGGSVLDLGCGPGNHAAGLQAAGFKVSATDASTAMLEIARKNTGLNVWQSEFADLDETDAYDGIWANFSLLHASRADFPKHLTRIATALRPRGILHLGMKTGSGERRDRLGRHYAYYSVEDLRSALQTAGLGVIRETPGKGPGLAGDIESWIIIIARMV